MWWKMTRSEFEKNKGESNREAMKALVKSGIEPGILVFNGNEPVGWCAVGPRENYPSLERSRILRRIDDQPVWSVVCFFIAKPWRRRGVGLFLLKSAGTFAASHGAAILEGYPVEPRKERTADVFVYTGLASTFRKAGFQETARRSPTRPIMRLALGGAVSEKR